MDESQQNLVGQNLQVLPRNLYAEDGDRGIQAQIIYSFDQLGGFQHQSRVESSSASNSLADEASVNVEHYLHLNPTSGELRLIRQWPNKWMASPMTLVVRATQADNKDRYTLTTLTITRPATASSISTSSTTPKSVKPDQQVASSESTSFGESRERHGLEFTPDRLNIQVAENTAINEKIAKVRAKYSPSRVEWPDSADDRQAVDLVQDWRSTSFENKTRRAELQQQVNLKRPINYQILDDPSEQFAINGLGEIFVKRQLDFEQRQEHKFRVLATYTKYSDTCQVSVNVLNMNDNKPKVSSGLGLRGANRAQFEFEA